MTTGWDKEKPAASTSLRLSNPEILTNLTAIEGFSGADHIGLEVNDDTVGQHTVVRMRDQEGDPSTVAGLIAFYNNENALFARLENSGRIIPLDASRLTETKSSAYTAVKTDIGKVLLVSGATTIDLTGAATLENGWFIYVKNIDVDESVIIDPDGSETIDGSATVTLDSEFDVIAIVCDGSNFHTIAFQSLAPQIDSFINAPHDHSDDDNGGNAIGVIQVVNTQTGAVATGTTSIPDDDTIPQISEGNQYMSLTFTPKDASNKLLIEIVTTGAHNNGGRFTAALFQDSTASAIAAMQKQWAGANQIKDMSFSHFMTAGTTSAITFKLRAGSDQNGIFTFNGISAGRLLGGVLAASITITEIKP